jgi:hypothetical protein
VLLVERIDGGEILHSGHPAAQAFERAQERPRADLGRAALGIAWRKCAQEPELERDGLEAALQENVMRVVVRVDEAGHQQLVSRVDGLIDGARAKLGEALAMRKRAGHSRTHRSNQAVHDPQIAGRRQMHVAVMIVDATVLYEDDVGGC